jgi:hypothetical protein
MLIVAACEKIRWDIDKNWKAHSKINCVIIYLLFLCDHSITYCVMQW